MNTKYFHNVTTKEELKAQYKKLAFKYHPDRPEGSTEAMQAINAEYEELIKILEVKEGEAQDLRDYQAIIDSLIQYNDITISIVGSWIWVEGETKAIKEQLKEFKFRWNNKRKLWQWKPANEEYSKSRNSKKSDAEVKEFWGCKVIKGNFTGHKPQLD